MTGKYNEKRWSSKGQKLHSINNFIIVIHYNKCSTFISAYSFIDLTKYLFNIPGVNSFLSERICQDPLEKFFGRQRQRGATNENPNISQFLKNNQALRVINSIQIDTSKGNTRGSKSSKVIPVTPQLLPKRLRCKKSKQIQSTYNIQPSTTHEISTIEGEFLILI